MNYKSNILLAFSLLLSICVAGQNLPDSVIITSITYVNDYNGGETLYDMKPFSLVYKQASYHSNDKIINKKKIISFLNELSNDSKNDNSLGKYGIDTTWVKNNPSELLKLYADKNRVEWNEQQKQFIYKKLTDISYYEKELRRYLDAGCCYTLHQNYRTDYRVSIYKNGELRNHITSRRRVGGYLFPWTNLAGDTLNGYQIESTLSDIISIEKQRKPPMRGDKLLKYLVNEIVDYNMITLYKLSAYSYQREIEELKSAFEIVSFEEVYGRGRYIWNESKTIKITLKNQLMVRNVSLNFLASVHGKTIYSRDSIKREYQSIIKRIQSIKFITEYLRENALTKLDIYYFNNGGINEYNIESVNKDPESWAKHDKYVESLKWYEKNNIAPSFDLNQAIKVSRQNDCGCDFRFDRSYIDKAIFFEIVDEKNSSIWFLLPDDQVLLYLMQGEKVLDLDYSMFGQWAGLQYPCALFNAQGQRIEK